MLREIIGALAINQFAILYEERFQGGTRSNVTCPPRRTLWLETIGRELRRAPDVLLGEDELPAHPTLLLIRAM